MEFLIGVVVTLAAVALAASFRRPKEFSDEETLEKVHTAMAEAGIPKGHQTLAIANIQDAGIFFREKTKNG